MTIIYYDNECKDGLTLEEVETVRNNALKLMNKNMHPRYDLAVTDLFKASNALMNEMKLDETRKSEVTNDEGNVIGYRKN